MQVIHSTKIAYFDADQTLVFSESELKNHPQRSTLGGVRFINSVAWYLDSRHYSLLREFKARGFTIVVWSAGGSEWAEKVVRSFNLTSYVDLVIGKPDFFIDDKPAAGFMPESMRTYIES